jgi:hypothetical protein
MWKRERMMVDVISFPVTNNEVPLQNRQFYPIGGGMMHDDANNFYAGNEYTVQGGLITRQSKRPLPFDNNIVSNSTKKKQKLMNSQHYQAYQSPPSPSPPPPPPSKTSYAFTSKPYDVMDNLMYYY